MRSLEFDDSTLSDSSSSTSPIANTNLESSGEMRFPRKALDKKLDGKGLGKTEKITAKNLSHTRDPVMADQQMRKKKVSKHFMALSSIVPGLKMRDEASILEDAIQYLKQLQEHVELLEGQLDEKSDLESAIFEEMAQLSPTDEASSWEENNGVRSELGLLGQLPEIEAKAKEKNVLIRIHCEKEKGHLSKILYHLEMLHINVINMCALPFGDHFLDITIVAQMGNEFCMAMKDLERNLALALLSFGGTSK